jgi:hypothetical protein
LAYPPSLTLLVHRHWREPIQPTGSMIEHPHDFKIIY